MDWGYRQCDSHFTVRRTPQGCKGGCMGGHTRGPHGCREQLRRGEGAGVSCSRGQMRVPASCAHVLTRVHITSQQVLGSCSREGGAGVGAHGARTPLVHIAVAGKTFLKHAWLITASLVDTLHTSVHSTVQLCVLCESPPVCLPIPSSYVEGVLLALRVAAKGGGDVEGSVEGKEQADPPAHTCVRSQVKSFIQRTQQGAVGAMGGLINSCRGQQKH